MACFLKLGYLTMQEQKPMHTLNMQLQICNEVVVKTTNENKLLNFCEFV